MNQAKRVGANLLSSDLWNYPQVSSNNSTLRYWGKKHLQDYPLPPNASVVVHAGIIVLNAESSAGIKIDLFM